MSSELTMRVDKWLWMVRQFKTRSLATEACTKGRVRINGVEAKPSREVKPGDTVTVRRPPVLHTLEVVGIPRQRVAAKLLTGLLVDRTPAEELQKLEPGYLAFQGHRKKGEGRPTKKERRGLDQMLAAPQGPSEE